MLIDRVLRCVAVAAGLVALTPTRGHSWSEVPICLAPSGHFRHTDLVSDGVGGAIVVWDDSRANPGDPNSAGDIYAQRVSSAGEVLWTFDGLPVCVSNGFQGTPRVIPDGAGGAIVFWGDYGPTGAGYDGLYVQRLSASGQLLWPLAGIRLDHGSGARGHQIVADTQGGAFVAWCDDGQIYAQHVDGGGQPWPSDRSLLPNPAACSIYGEEYAVLGLIPDGAGGCIVAWAESCRAGILSTDSVVVHAQRLDVTGAVLWPGGGVRVDAFLGTPLSFVPLGGGQSLLGWRDLRHFGGGSIQTDLYAQRISAGGASEWPAGGRPIWEAPDTLSTTMLSLCPDAVGGAFAVWDTSPFYSDDPSRIIFAQHLDAAGNHSWDPGGILLATGPARRDNPLAIPDAVGGSIALWNDDRNSPIAWTDHDVYAQRVNPSGTPLWASGGVPITPIPSLQYLLGGIADGAGGAIVLYLSAGLYAARLENDGTPTQLSLVTASATSEGVRLHWFSEAGRPVMATLHRDRHGSGWQTLATLHADGSGNLRYEDAPVLPGEHIGYRLEVWEGGVERLFGETWITVPSEARLSIASLSPNPADRPPIVAFELPRAAGAYLELVDISGRRLASRDVGRLGVGVHAVRLSEAAELAPGVYVVRLRQGANWAKARLVVAR